MNLSSIFCGCSGHYPKVRNFCSFRKRTCGIVTWSFLHKAKKISMSKDEVLSPITRNMTWRILRTQFTNIPIRWVLETHTQPKINTANTNQKSEGGKPPPVPPSAWSLWKGEGKYISPYFKRMISKIMTYWLIMLALNINIFGIIAVLLHVKHFFAPRCQKSDIRDCVNLSRKIPTPTHPSPRNSPQVRRCP